MGLAKAAAIALIGACILLCSSFVSACSCAREPFEYESMLKYPLIVGGTVVGAEKENGPLRFRVKTANVFRGGAQPEYEFVSDGEGGGDCGWDQITVGLYYVFFVKNPPSLSICTLTYAPSQSGWDKEEIDRRHRVLYEKFPPLAVKP